MSDPRPRGFLDGKELEATDAEIARLNALLLERDVENNDLRIELIVARRRAEEAEDAVKQIRELVDKIINVFP